MSRTASYPGCYSCGADVQAREDQLVVQFSGEDVLFQRVPMGVCTRCGQRFLTARIARRMEQALVLCSLRLATTPGGLRTVREALALSQAQFARRLGVAGGTISRWETGRARPSAGVLRRLDALRRKLAGSRRTG